MDENHSIQQGKIFFFFFFVDFFVFQFSWGSVCFYVSLTCVLGLVCGECRSSATSGQRGEGQNGSALRHCSASGRRRRQSGALLQGRWQSLHLHVSTIQWIFFFFNIVLLYYINSYSFQFKLISIIIFDILS